MLRRLLVGWLIAVQVLAECSCREETSRLRIVVIPKGTTHAFWQAIRAGAEKAAKEHGGVEIIWEGPAREDQRQEQQNIVERFTSTGVLQALRALKRVGRVQVVGFDGSDVLIAALRAGDVQGLVLQDPFDMGYRAVKRVLDARTRPVPAAERTLYTSLGVATPANVDEAVVRALYAPDLKSFLPK